MKEKIHPKYGEAKVTCACGASFVTGSVKKELRVDVCSKCHPFFTGPHRIIQHTLQYGKMILAQQSFCSSAVFIYTAFWRNLC